MTNFGPALRQARSGDVPIWDAQQNQWVPNRLAKLVTGLPTGAQDGQMVRYRASGAFVNTSPAVNLEWMFSYNSAENYWYHMGGGPAVNFSTAADTTTSLTYVAPTNAQEMSFPLSGDWLVALHSDLSNSVSNYTTGAAISYDIGAFGANDDWSVFTFKVDAGVRFGRPYYLHTGVVAGDKLKIRLRAVNAGTGRIAQRLINIVPFRVR